MIYHINPSKIKAVALDLDGTLLNAENEISPLNKKAVLEAKRLGKKIVIATGRSYRALLPYARELDIRGPVVCYNGAAVYACPSGKKLVEYPLDSQWAHFLIKAAREYDVHLHFFIEEKWYYEKERREVDQYAQKCGFRGVLKNFDDIPDLSCTKAMFVGESEVLNKLQIRLNLLIGNDVYMAFSSKGLLEIMQKGVSKAHALEETTSDENIEL